MRTGARRRAVLTKRMARAGAAALAIGMAAGACTGTKIQPPPFGAAAALAGGALQPFSSCDALLQYVKANAPTYPGSAMGGFAVDAATAGGAIEEGIAESGASGRMSTTTMPSPTTAAARRLTKAGDSADVADDSGFSTTNVQEKDVDEPDLVKTDGRRMVVLAGATLNILDVTSSEPKLLGSYDFAFDGPVHHELLLVGDRVVAFGGGFHRGLGDDVGRRSSYSPMISSSGMTVLDIADPAKPKRVATMTFEGRYVSARLANGVVRLVVHAAPKGPEIAYDNLDHSQLESAYRAAVERSTVEDWLPTYTLERPGEAQKTEPLAPCASVLHAKDFAGMSTVSVLTVDPDDPQPANPACVLGAGETVYASLDSLVVATSSWQTGTEAVRPGAVVTTVGNAPIAPVSAGTTGTDLHQFSIKGAGAAAYQASGRVEGTLLNQFAMSEHEGRLRLATTVFGPTGTDNVLHVLERKDAKLEVVGRLAGLGHEMESIHSVRFVGDRAYIVTFRRTDPLYVINLSDPRHPVKEGELEVPGFSSYLHPLSETSLLGVGQAPAESGGQGLQVSLFDVSDPARPVRIDNIVFPNAYSAAQQEHHAFTWWPKTGQLFLPISESAYGGVIAIEVEPSSGFGTKTRVAHASVTNGAPYISVMRTVVVGSRLLSVADIGLLTSGLPGLQPQSWLAW